MTDTWNASDVPVVSSAAFVIPMTAFVILHVAIIVGNSLVIAAVFTHVKLRSALTNRFIVSLAAADLLVGMTVLPFSSANSLLRYWPFGSTWCSIWLAVDVWMCTASILNLCAISFDRYLAISRPFRYPQLMTPLRVKILIIAVWILSFVICLPPLVGWNERRRGKLNEWMRSNEPDSTTGYVYSLERTSSRDFPLECTLTSEPGYIVYSSLGSFWIPMVVMLGFYWRIYRTAAEATAAIRRGFLDVSSSVTSGAVSTSSSDNSITLRVHRGGGSPTRRSDGCLASESQRTSTRNSFTRVLKNKVASRGPRFAVVFQQRVKNPSKVKGQKRKVIQLPRIVVTSNDALPDAASTSLELLPPPPHSKSGREIPPGNVGFPTSYKKTSVISESSRLFKLQSILPQMRSLKKEKKAAKTVGVIVGFFILSWAPFFTLYLLRAFWPGLTPPVVFNVCFWLGYCNSAFNPVIYGLCSKDFCYAFKKLMRCRCERKRSQRGPVAETRLARMLGNFRIQIATTTTASNSDINLS